MSSAASPNPNNLILLAVIGIGAYWLMTRRAVAQPVYQGRPVAQQGNNTAGIINALGGLFRGIGGSGGGGGGGYVPSSFYQPNTPRQVIDRAAAAADRDNDPAYNGSVSDYVGNDGLAFNPPFGSAFDVAYGIDSGYYAPA